MSGGDRDCSYVANTRKGLQGGMVIAIGTAGIWETCNAANGEMSGLTRFMEPLRDNAHLPASEILNRSFSGLDEFRQGIRVEDDITLVIIKIAGS